MIYLPKGWIKARLSDFCDIIQGQSPPGSTYNNEARGIPFFQGKTDFGPRNPVPRVWCDQPSKIADAGDILISIRAPVGPTNIAEQTCAIGRGLAAVRPLGNMQTSFVLHAIRAHEHNLRSIATGSTFAAVSGAQLRDLEIPLPPHSEQQRIAAEIEKQFTRLDCSEELLVRSEKRLQQFRRSGINLACHSLAQRSLRAFGEIVEGMRNGISTKPIGTEGTEILKISAVRPFQLRLEERRFIQHANEYEPFKLKASDLLFTRYNGSRELVGVCARVPILEKDLLYPDKLIRVRLKGGHEPSFYELMFNVGPTRDHVRSRIRTTAGQSGISASDLKSAPVPEVTRAEQLVVVDKVNYLLSNVERLASELQAAKSRVIRLRQSILAKAFCGQLVPQDPNDEPASLLLDRIREQRGKADRSTTRPARRRRATLELS